MANEIVKYENTFNKVVLSDFNTIEMNILFAIISRVRERRSRQVTFSDHYLKQLANYRRNNDFKDYLMGTYNKISQLKGTITNGKVVARFTLFTGWVYDQEKGSLTVQVNPDYLGYFNDLENWTRFALDDFTSLRSAYSKTMFRLLKQYRTIGQRKFTMEEFREQLGIPPKYRPSEINRRVLSYIQEELSTRFRNFKIEKIRKGRRIAGYLFTWTPEQKKIDEYAKSKESRQAEALANIYDNDNLTEDQKWAAEDRLLGLRLGTTKSEREKMNAQDAKAITATEEDKPKHVEQMDLLSGEDASKPAGGKQKQPRKYSQRRGHRLKEPIPEWLKHPDDPYKKASPEDVAAIQERIAKQKKPTKK